MRACALRVLCLLGVLGGGAAPAWADVAGFLGRTVSSVRLAVEGRETTDPLLIQVLSTTAGEPLSMVQVRETVAHLFSLGRFEGVSVDATLDNGLVALRYDLIPIHAVMAIRYL